MNTKLHAVADANGRPLSFFMTAGQVSDYTGAAALLDDLPKAQWLLGDRGYDADWFRDALQAKGIQPCIPGRRSRNEPVRYDKRRYRRRGRIEIMFGRCLIPRFDGAILSLEWKEAVWGKYVTGAPGSVRNFVCGRAAEHYAAMALMKRSPKMTANWALAMVHSRGGILHSFSERFKMR